MGEYLVAIICPSSSRPMSGANFKQAAADPKGLEQALLGPSYSYSQFVKLPSQMGMSGNGGMNTLASDIEGIMAYVDILV